MAIAMCSAVFIAALGMISYWDASIRPLLRSLPSLAASVLCARRTEFEYALAVELFGRERVEGWWARRTKVGYAVGVASGAVGALITGGWSFIFVGARNGIPVRAAGVHLLTAVATAGLVFFSLVGYARLPNKSRGDVALFVAAIILVAAFLFVTLAGAST
jgi:cation transport ATPase